MSKEQMEAQRSKVIETLKAAGFEEVVPLDFEDGDALPIGFTTDVEGESNMFVLELNLV